MPQIVNQAGESMSSSILIHDEDGIVTITLNEPEQRNPISNSSLLEGLLEAVVSAEANSSTSVVILTGTGSAFSSGGNVKSMLDGGGIADPAPSKTRTNYKNGIQRLPLVFDALEVPVIAAVNGPAIGAGCDLALMADIRIAAQSAWFAESFVNLGIVPGDGGAWLLPRAVGYSKAAEMAFTGDKVSAQEALAFGLVSRVVPDHELLDAAREIARRIAANPRHSVRMAKRMLKQGRASSLADHLELAAAMQAIAHTTREHREAVTAFIEKRKPNFNF
jgi:enoyl-CoA hydratase/carnithine racemase